MVRVNNLKGTIWSPFLNGQLMKLSTLFCFVISIVLLRAPICIEASEIASMVKVEKWEDVKPFAGKIVAYTTNSSFFLSKDGCSFDDAKIKYGYIPEGFGDWLACDESGHLLHPYEHHRDRGWGYRIMQLVALGNFCLSYKPLVNFRLKDAQLAMRCVHLPEAVKIGEAIYNGKAYFDGESIFVNQALISLVYDLQKIKILHDIVDDILPRELRVK